MSFMEIFQPGLKYLREERERQRMNVAYPTDGADPLMEIDLEAGTATIVIMSRPQDQSSDDSTQPSTASGATDPTDTTGEAGATDPTDATGATDGTGEAGATGEAHEEPRHR